MTDYPKYVVQKSSEYCAVHRDNGKNKVLDCALPIHDILFRGQMKHRLRDEDSNQDERLDASLVQLNVVPNQYLRNNLDQTADQIHLRLKTICGELENHNLEIDRS